jgi:hypothetical protein
MCSRYRCRQIKSSLIIHQQTAYFRSVELTSCSGAVNPNCYAVSSSNSNSNAVSAVLQGAVLKAEVNRTSFILLQEVNGSIEDT